MSKKEESLQKPTFAYVSFHAMPQVVDQQHKLKKYAFAYDFLFILTSTFRIFVYEFTGKEAFFTKQNIRFYYFKQKQKLFLPLKLFLKLRYLQPNVIYIQGLSYPHYIILMKLFLKNNPKILVQDHANTPVKGLKKTIFKLADKYVSGYFFASKKMGLKYVKEGLISSENKIVENVEGSTQFTYNPSVKKDPNSFLWVGRLDKNKDPITVLTGFKEYFLHNSKATLTMFYEDETLLKEIKEFIDINKLTKQVRLKGSLTHKKLEKWYQKSQFFILGSHKEGGPISLIEAMACGCIPIVTNIPAFKAMTNNGECGFLFEPENSKELASILENLPNIDINLYQNRVINFFNTNLSHLAISKKIVEAVLG